MNEKSGVSRVVRLETGYRAPITKALNIRARLLRARAIASYNLEACEERDAVVADITAALAELDGEVATPQAAPMSHAREYKRSA